MLATDTEQADDLPDMHVSNYTLANLLTVVGDYLIMHTFQSESGSGTKNCVC